MQLCLKYIFIFIYRQIYFQYICVYESKATSNFKYRNLLTIQARHLKKKNDFQIQIYYYLKMNKPLFYQLLFKNKSIIKKSFKFNTHFKAPINNAKKTVLFQNKIRNVHTTVNSVKYKLYTNITPTGTAHIINNSTLFYFTKLP